MIPASVGTDSANAEPSAPDCANAEPSAPDWTVPRRRILQMSARSTALLVACSTIGLLAYLWPFFRTAGTASSSAALSQNAHSTDAVVLLVGLLPLLIAVVLVNIADDGFDARAAALLGVLTAASAVLRIPGGGVSGFSPMFFLVALAGRVFGPAFGFVLGAMAMLVSAILTGGVGPWLPFQMFGLAWIGAGAGLLPRCSGKTELLVLIIYGAITGFLFGALLNLWFWPFAVTEGSAISYRPGAPLSETVERYGRFYVATSLGWDLVRAVGNAIMIWLTGATIIASLRRAAHRGAFLHR